MIKKEIIQRFEFKDNPNNGFMSCCIGGQINVPKTIDEYSFVEVLLPILENYQREVASHIEFLKKLKD